jgi:hypothetical protein
MTNPTDPAEQWSDLLAGLTRRRRAAVVSALRSSAEQGWPADAEAVRLLVAYAVGEIDSQGYALGMVRALSGQQHLAEPPARARREPAAPDLLEPADGTASIEAERRMTREEAVAAYVSGSISVEEFLRASRGLSA